MTGIALHPYGAEPPGFFSALAGDPSLVLKGLPFALSLLFIIGCHEAGHVYGASRNGIASTKPFFIPAPPFFTLGTLGAFIKVKGWIPSRGALVEMGTLGPIWGFLASASVMVAGLACDAAGYRVPTDFGFNVRFPLGYAAIRYLFTGDLSREGMLFENPFTAAAFIGFFIQGLNLLPVGQLDGGHIVYALFPRAHRWIGRAIAGVFVLLSPLGLHFLVWAVLFFVLGFNHPPARDDAEPMTAKQKTIAVSGIFIFILSFEPLPFVT